MSGSFLTNSERQKLEQFPPEITEDDLAVYFTLTPADKLFIMKQRGEYNRLGFAVLFCTLRYLGFCPNNLQNIPVTIIDYVRKQLKLSSNKLEQYGNRAQTRTEHLQAIQHYLGFRKVGKDKLQSITDWLIDRALEHDSPSLLLTMLCEKLHTEKLLCPGITVLEGIVINARNKAQAITFNKVQADLSGERKMLLDKLLVNDPTINQTPLNWLRFGETSNSPQAILNVIRKSNYIRSLGVDSWDLSLLNPNRRKLLTQFGRRSTNQALQRTSPERRYLILMAFLKQTLEDATDELIELFDRCLWDCYSRAKHELEKLKLQKSSMVNEKIRLLKTIGGIILDTEIDDVDVRKTVYQEITEEKFALEITECIELIRPKNDKCYDLLGKRFSYLREFAPYFLNAVEFSTNRSNHELLNAVELLQSANEDGKRKIAEDAPIKFINRSWAAYVFEKDDAINRRYYEICTLWELRQALRCGDIWVEGSRKYNDPESYLIPKNDWPSKREEACQLLGLPENGDQWLDKQMQELEVLLEHVDKRFSRNENARIEKGKLVLSPLFAEDLPSSVDDLQGIITEQLPRLDITDLLIEVDHWTNFSDCFTHAGGSQTRTKDFLVHLYASLLAQACNFGLKKMAEITGLTYDKLAWCTNWNIREETLQAAINTLVNYQYQQPLSKLIGSGTLSSSDGERIPVPIKARNATALPKYFGYGKGLTFYSWTSDQFSQFGTKVIPATVRDATYVLDALLDNQTELQILEHTTDTAGYTELVFGLFPLFTMLFAPRIRDLGDQHLYRIDNTVKYKHIDKILKGVIHRHYVIDYWDDNCDLLLR